MIELLAPGDIYIAEKETLQFHKGMSYQIANVYHDQGKLVATIIDKWGKEVLFVPYLFKINSKTNSNQMLRHLQALLEIWFNNNGVFTYWKGWLSPSPFYEVSSSTVHSNRGKNIEGDVCTELKFRNNTNEPWQFVDTQPRFEFFSKKECIDHYFNLLKGSYQDDYYAIHLADTTSDFQNQLNLLTYILMAGINTMPLDKAEEVLKTPIDMGGRHTDQCRYDMEPFISFLNELIFDKKITDAEVKGYVQEIIKLFMVVPGSWAATACANVLLGKGKTNNSKTQPFWEKFVPLGLKMPQVFEFVDHVDSFMYEHKVFQTKDSYCSDQNAGFRGQYEFIGSKYIDKGKLEEYLK